MTNIFLLTNHHVVIQLFPSLCRIPIIKNLLIIGREMMKKIIVL